jgi:cation diffusion facilitator family transporter
MSYRSDIRLQRNVLLIGFVLMGIKAIAYFITNSNAILTDALESLVNIGAGGFSLFSLYYASKPSDSSHPYGHGKIEFISGVVEGVLIGITGLSMMVKSIYGFFHPDVISSLDIGLALAFGAGLVNFIMGIRLEKRGKAKNSMSMQSEGAHLKSDGYTSFALVAGLGIVLFTELYWLDNVVALLLAIYISLLSYSILRKSLAGIMDETDPELNKKALDILKSNRKAQWIDFHEFRIIRYGRSIHIDCHLVLPFYFNIKQAHDEVTDIENLIGDEIGRESEIFIHTDPCTEDYCKQCQVANCDFRKQPYQKPV